MKVVTSKLVRSPSMSSRKQPTLKEFYEGRNRILINREIGGLGDILMHRMMFEDFKSHGIELHFACPTKYHPAVEDHPYLDKLLDCEKVNPYDYVVSYNTTTACGRYEMMIAPRSGLHRSDIWSKHCGLDLENHEMHIILSQSEKEYGRKLLSKVRAEGKPVVAICPVSSMINKDLIGTQITGVIDELRKMGFSPFGVHTKPVREIEAKGVSMLHGLGIRQWMSAIDAADYVIAVDTSAFHLAGGLKKPLVGVFSFADGKTYGRYFDFELVQRHRDDGNWECGPCYNWPACPKSQGARKPCISEITSEDVMLGFERLLKKHPAK